MKLLFTIMSIIMFSVTGYSQRVITDTLQGAETVNFLAMQDASQISVLCTELGGTSDGTLILQGSSNKVNFVTLTSTAGLFNFYPNDTLTITDGAVWLIDIQGAAFNYYRVVGGGTSGDTTLITIDWSKR